MAKTAAKAATPINLKSLVAHALADTVPGGMTNEEHNALVEDLREHGMQVPIVLYEGKILDGRERYRAAQTAGIEIKHREFEGDELAARNLVFSLNLERRTLTTMQKAYAVAEMYKRAVNDPKSTAKPSQDAMCKRYGVSKMSLSLCCKAIDGKNTMLLTRLKRGEVSRGELEEEFYDRDAANATQPTGTATEGGGDIFGSAPPAAGGLPANVTDMTSRLPSGPLSRGGKVDHPERKARESAASVCVQQFKALTESDKAAFVKMAWAWLQAPVEAYQATVKAAGTSAAAPITKSRKSAKAA